MSDEQKPEPAAPLPVVARRAGGRFMKGNPGGPGNPHAQAIHLLRSRAIRFFAGKPEKIERLLKTLEQIAMDPRQPGLTRVAAIRELLSRGLGKPTAIIELAAPAEITVEPQASGG